MAEQAYAYVTLIPVAKGFQSAVAKELAGVGGPGGTAGKAAGKSFTDGFGGSLKKLAGMASIALAATGVGKFFSDSVSQASNLNESLNAVNVSFGKNAEGIKKLGQEAATSLGLSTQQFNQLAVGFTAFTEKIAGPGGDVVKVMDDLTTRGADFASVMNLDVNEAMGLFRAGLAGETEPLRRYGIDVSEASVKAFAYANNIAATGTELTEQQKIQARYGAIMEQTNRMAGDFANTSDGLANAQRILKAEFANVQAEVGAALLPALQALIPALTPLVKELGPVLVTIMEALAPVITMVADNLGPLFDALEPLIEVFGLFVEVGGTLLEAILPPFIDILDSLAPVALSLVEAMMPLIRNVLPALAELVQVIVPVLTSWFDILAKLLLPVIQVLADVVAVVLTVALKGLTTVLQTVIGWLTPFFEAMKPGIIEAVNTAVQGLTSFLKPLWAQLEPIVNALLAWAGIDPKSLNKSITVTTTTVSAKGEDNRFRNLQNSTKPVTTTTSTTPVTSPANSAAAEAAKAAAAMRAKVKELIQDTKKALIENRKKYNEAVSEANQDYMEAQTDIAERYDKAITEATMRRDKAMGDALKNYNQSVAKINEDTAKKLADVIAQSMNRLRDAFRSAAEVNIADMFSSDAINKSVGGLVDGLRTKLTQSRQLIANAAELASKGFSQTFIEQVVAAGGEAGNELAQGILNSTPEQQRELKDLFNVIESEAGTGMDSLAQTLYEKNGLATTELKNLYASVLEDQRVALAEQKTLYDEQIAEIMVSFNQEVADAKVVRDEALLDAEETLNQALLDANTAFLAGLDEIDKEFKEKIKGMKAAAKAMKTEIDALQSSITTARANATTVGGGLATLRPMATGGLVTGPTPALVGEAGPELVIPLDRFESLAAETMGGKVVNYYAAPNQSIDSEQALFQAMRRAKVVASW